MLVYLKVSEKAETCWLKGRDKKTFVGQINAPVHMGILSWVY